MSVTLRLHAVAALAALVLLSACGRIIPEGHPPGGLPPPATLARSGFLEAANEVVADAMRLAGEA